MSEKDKSKVIRLLCMQINSHVNGDTRHSDKVLALTEVMLVIKQMQNSVSSILSYVPR